MIKGKPCKVKDVSVSKTGKHGHAKCKFSASDIFTGASCEELCPSTHSIDVPVVNKKDWMIQGHDICHGGYIFLLADTAMAYASNSRNKANLAMNANIDFLRPAKLGENLTASAVEGNKSKNTGLYDVKVTNEANILIGHFRGRTFNTQAEVL